MTKIIQLHLKDITFNLFCPLHLTFLQNTYYVKVKNMFKDFNVAKINSTGGTQKYFSPVIKEIYIDVKLYMKA